MEDPTVIWLPSLPERLPIIKKLEENLKTKVRIFHAIDGKQHEHRFAGFKHIQYSQQINAGMIGCLLSHLDVLKNSQSKLITVFEDDCVFHGNLEELQSFIQKAPSFDILGLS